MHGNPHPLTLTHARLRRAQGDARGAIEVVEAMIDAGEEGDELWRLYVALGGDRQRPHGEPDLPRHKEPVPAASADLTVAFRRALGNTADPRIDRLERWLSRLRRAAR